MDVPPVDIDTSTISVSECSDISSSGCLKLNGYQVYKQDLLTAGTQAKEKSPSDDLYLRLYLDNNLIRLHDSPEGKHIPLEYQDTIHDLYVYYYGHTDTRPLLLCYGDKAYRPNSVADYGTKWVREMKISKCLCQNNDDDKKLLDVLSDVVGILNAVQLKRPGFVELKSESRTGCEYSVQKFNGDDIRINVTCEDQKCYRVYTHIPIGTHRRNDGFRLGYVKYESASPDASSLKYTSPKPLSKVSAYYSLYDIELQYPLLVVLEFKETGKNYVEYYKLSDKKSKKWAKIKSEDEGGTNDDSNFLKKLKELQEQVESTPSAEIPDKLQDHIERKAYNIRNDLGIKFEKKENAGTLFDPKNCKEDGINIAAIAGGTVGTAAVIGTGATVGVIVSKNLAAGAAAAAATTIAL